MLVLARKIDEAVLLTLTEPLPAGAELRVMLVRCTDGVARLGFDCPAEVRISREELLGKPAPAAAGIEQGALDVDGSAEDGADRSASTV